MAYTADEFQIVVTGRMGPSEVWSNTWTILDVVGSQPRTPAVSQVRGFYNDCIGLFPTSWHADAAVVRPLSTGVGSPALWESFTGTNTSALLPTQLACRVSLDDLSGHNGGPFIAGFTEDSNDANGLMATGHRSIVSGAVQALANGLETEGFQLRIDRPTVTSTVAALRARVGLRWDVIRRRSDNVPEAYSNVIL